MRKLALIAALIFATSFVDAQNKGTGIRPFGSYTSSGFDAINNQNLNAYFTIPLVSSTGRGMPLNLTLSNNSLLWQQVLNGSTYSWSPVTDANGNPTWGWQKDFPSGSLSYQITTNQTKCFEGSQWYWATITYYGSFVYSDAVGTRHNFPTVSFHIDSCPTQNGSGGTKTGGAGDYTGYFLNATNTSAITVTSPRGEELVKGNGTSVDSNGNFITRTVVSSTETDFTDSVGNTALKIIYTPSTTAPTSIQYEFLDGTGHYQTITLKTQSYNIKTNFACSSVSEYTGTAYMPYELDIPSPVSGTLKYLFTYEGTPGNSGYYTGRIQKVTLPTGGYYSYTYSATNDGVDCSDGTTLSMTRTVNDNNGNTATWNFVRNTSNMTTKVTTPALPDIPNAFDTLYTFNSSGQEVSHQIYTNTSDTTVLRTLNTSWAANGTPSASSTILEDGSTQNSVATTFDSNGLLDSMTEYDFGTGSPGSPIRTTNYTYQTNTNYASRNIINLVISKQILDGSGTVQYRQDTTYDGTTLVVCPTGVPQHDDTDFPCTMNYRGNPTALTTYLTPGTPANGITKNFTYDWFGNLLTAQLNCCTQKTWAFSSATQYSQPDSVTSGTSPNQLTTSYNYNTYLGLVTESTDPNSLVTSYSYDFLRRPTQVSQVNGSVNGQTVTYTYNDSTFVNTVETTLDITTGSPKSVQQISALDGLGRAIKTTVEDINGNPISVAQSKYDLIGRAYSVTNPYTGTPSTYYWTTTAFDVLGRPASITLPDGSATNYSYSIQTIGAYKSETTLVTDPAGKLRQYQSDAAGRLFSVTEPSSGNSTFYTYTVLDELYTVADAQSSPTQTRTYVYDALGRLFTTTTPEGGTTCFGTASGGSCTANTGYDNFNNLLSRTDARGVLTSYSYDGLNRLTGVSYNVGTTGVPATSSVGLTYGASGCSTAHGAGCIGQLITMTDGPGSENYTYNALEQLTQLQKIISGTTYTTNYAYNVANELAQITYPSGRVIQQSVDAIGRLCEVAPSSPTGCGSASSPYATGFIYSPASQLEQLKYGNNLYGTFGYSPDRLQLNCLDYSNQNRSGSCAHDTNTRFGLDYTYATSTTNNGQITKISDDVDSGRTAAYSYDSWGRLSAAHTSGSTTYPAWSLTWGYDQYGNRLNQTLISGSGYQGSLNVDPSTNRIKQTTGTTFAYDAGGNMTNDNTNTLVYDAENRAVSATNPSASGTYTYDGNGLRVTRASGSTTTVYIFSGSKVVAEYDNGAAPTAPSREYIYASGTMLAKVDSTGTNYYYRDHLSARYVANASGTLVEQMGTYPFGDPWYNANNDKLLFTTYERDSESGNDYAQARFYRWLLGRFLSLDPISGSIFDPQSLDRYPYTQNNPIGLVDPTGMDACIASDDLDCLDGGGGGAVLNEIDPDPGGGVQPIPTCQTPLGPGFCPIINQPRNPGSDWQGNLPDNGYGYLDPSQGGGDLTGGGSNGSIFIHIRNIARNVGKHVPFICSGGVFNSAGVGTNGPVSVGVSPHFQQADFGLSQGKLYSTYSEGVFVEASGGEVIQGGVGQAHTYGHGQSLANSNTTETFLFAGVGASTPYLGANVSAFYATPSSFGISLSGNLLAFQGGVGGYVNVSSVTSCFGF